MNSIAKWILESVTATVVIIICLGIPQVLSLPRWTLALSVVPIVLYLSWRLDGQAFAWGRIAAFAVILGVLILLQREFLPESWRSWSPYLVVIIASLLGSFLRRKRKETHHAA